MDWMPSASNKSRSYCADGPQEFHCAADVSLGLGWKQRSRRPFALVPLPDGGILGAW